MRQLMLAWLHSSAVTATGCVSIEGGAEKRERRKEGGREGGRGEGGREGERERAKEREREPRKTGTE